MISSGAKEASLTFPPSLARNLFFSNYILTINELGSTGNRVRQQFGVGFLCVHGLHERKTAVPILHERKRRLQVGWIPLDLVLNQIHHGNIINALGSISCM